MRDDNVCVKHADNITERQRELLLRYWTRDGYGRFSSSVQELAVEWNESTTNLLHLVRAAGTAYLEQSRCQQCDGFIYVDCRSSLNKHLLHPSRPCDVCRYGLEEEVDEGASAPTPDTVQPVRAESNGDAPRCIDTRAGEGGPVKLEADHIISLEAFARDPGSVMAAFRGSRLAVLDDNKPAFYCLPSASWTDSKPGESASNS